MSASPSDNSSQGGEHLGPGRAALVLLGIVVVLAGFVGIAYFLHIEAVFAGSFFIFFWLGIEKASLPLFLPTLTGAIGGTANASIMHPQVAGVLGIDPGISALLCLLILLGALYLLLMGKLPILINHSYMLFLTVGLIPQLSDPALVFSMFQGILLAAVYFGALVWLLNHLGARRAKNAAVEAVSFHEPQ